MAEFSGKNCTIMKKLMENQSLLCQYCNKLLQIPVIFVEGVGNVCNNCTLENEWQGPHIEIFDVFLQELTIPCTNANAGCNEQIKHEHFDAHLKVCKFRPVKCPREGCTWMEIQNHLSSHFRENHKEDVIENDTFHFKFDYLEPPHQFSKFLIKRHLSFLFVVKLNAYQMICKLFKFEESAPRSTTITFRNDEEQEFSFTIKINPLDMIDGINCVGIVSLPIIKAIFQENNVLSMFVNLPPNNCTLQSLDCSVCEKLMKPPIFQCTNGHSLCNNCVIRLKKCPSCNATIDMNIRNYHLERSTVNMFYSCAYKASGCCAVCSGEEIMAHESNCSHRLYKCPLDCQFLYNSKTILNHLSVGHASVTNKFQFDCNYGLYGLSAEKCRKFMYIDGRFFRFHYTLNPVVFAGRDNDDRMEWTMLELELLNSNKEVNDLYCKISMTSPTAKATVSLLWYLNRSGGLSINNHDCYSILIPIECWGESLDLTRHSKDTDQFHFECELFRK